MSSKKFIPYSIGDYNKIVDEFQLNKINFMEKEELLDNLKNPESWIYDCYLKKQSINLFLHTGGFIRKELFCEDDLFKRGVETTIMQIRKKLFFNLIHDDNLTIIRKIQSRISSNLFNYFSSKRKINYFQFENLLTQENDYYEIFEEIIFEIDLERIDKETLKYSLRKVWEDSIGDMDFDIQDFEELCTKYGFTPLDVLIYDPYMLPSMSKEACNNGNYQLVLVFQEEEIV